MVDLDIHSDMVPVSEFHDPVKIKPEDFEALRDVQAHVDALTKYRQEMGRLVQALNNMTVQANDVEKSLAGKRKELANKYNLETIGDGQWAMDFEKKEFVRLSGQSPIIP